MRRTQSSMTAVGIAIVRGIESARPERERICYDPYARRLVNDALYRFVAFFERLGYSERRGPGVMGFLVARERHIDEHLRACLTERLDQLVILGAGYDARAYRFEELKRGVRVFEVDHPATQADKVARLEKILRHAPRHVTFVPIDFNTQALGQRLVECGYDERAVTLFIWQGVTQYLTPEAVDSTLSFVVNHSAPGSSIIFDYVYTSLLDGTVKHGEVATMRRQRWVSGESMVFGIPQGRIVDFMQERGFVDVLNADGAVLHNLYFQGVAAKRTVADGYAIVSARVPPAATDLA